MMGCPTAKIVPMSLIAHPELLISVTLKNHSSAELLAFAFPSHGIVTAMLTVKMEVMNQVLVVKWSAQPIISGATTPVACSNRGSAMELTTAEMVQMKIIAMLVVPPYLAATVVNGLVLMSPVAAFLWPKCVISTLIVLMTQMKALVVLWNHAQRKVWVALTTAL